MKVARGTSSKQGADGFLDKKKSARFTSVSCRTLDYARASGDLPFYRVGRGHGKGRNRGRILFRVSDLVEWLERFRIDVTEAETLATGNGKGVPA